MKKGIIVIFTFLFVTNTHSQNIFSPTKLRTDLLLNTGVVSTGGISVNTSLSQDIVKDTNYQFAKVFNTQPHFDWLNAKNISKVTAWRVLVASSLQNLNNNIGDVWDSKKQSGSQNPVVFAGKPLVVGNIYYWKVQQWNEVGAVTSFSQPTAFYLAATDTVNFGAHAPLAAELQPPSKFINQMNGAYFIDFGKDAFSQLQLNLNSEKTDSIYIEVAEALGSNGDFLKSSPNIRYKKIGLYVQKGEQHYTLKWPVDAKRNSRNPIQMPAYIGEVFPFRYVRITGFAGSMNASSIKRKNIFYPFNNTAADFVSSDTVLNKVWELCKYSIKATSFSGFYVDGDRERIPYEADALINQLSHYAVDAEYNIARRSMAYLIFHPTWPTEWSLQNVLMAWNDYIYTGDKSFIQKYYTELQQKILMPLARQDGLISTLEQKQTKEFLETIHITKAFDGKKDLRDNVDWPVVERDGFVFCNYNAVINAFYYKNLLLMHQIALLVGNKADAQLYSQKAKQVYDTYQKLFIDPTSGLVKDGDTTTHVSLHGNMFALAFGLVSKQNMASVITYIKSKKMACSVYGAQFLLDALYDAGEAKYALELLTATDQRSWYNMIKTGATISMEAWDKVYKPNLDINHAWGAAPANIIVRKLMGVQPLNPGADTISIKPQLANLQFAKLKTNLIKGEVTIDYRHDADKEVYQLSIPSGTLAMLDIRSNYSNTIIKVDGKKMNLPFVDGVYKINHLLGGNHTIELSK
jgi:hypothetical protein